ncbi:MAG: Nudix family hydrolase [Pseudohongiellaceae bacterium]
MKTAMPVHVAVGVIVDDRNRVLTSLRSSQLHQGGLWEFPGGKLEANENVIDALQRELAEELGITIDPAACFPLKKVIHHYSDKSVLLDIWQVNAFTGEPHGQEGQPVVWQAIERLDQDRFPAADLAIIQVLKLPRCIAVSGDFSSMEQLRAGIQNLAAKKIQLVQLRKPDTTENEFLSFARHAAELCHGLNMRLQINAHPALAGKIPGVGLHVNSATLLSLDRRPTGLEELFSASCHNLDELHHAESVEVDFAFLSPVKPSASHPLAIPMGWSGFRSAAAQVSIPVYALGGVAETDLTTARRQGAHGIAAISAFWDIQELCKTGDNLLI